MRRLHFSFSSICHYNPRPRNLPPPLFSLPQTPVPFSSDTYSFDILILHAAPQHIQPETDVSAYLLKSTDAATDAAKRCVSLRASDNHSTVQYITLLTALQERVIYLCAESTYLFVTCCASQYHSASKKRSV